MVIIPETIYNSFEQNAKVLQYKHHAASPFPHSYFDHVISPLFLRLCESTFPNPTKGNWWSYSNQLEKKLARNDLHNFPWPLKLLIQEMQSSRFVSLIEKITEIPGLIVDHTLNGGGLHQITRGGKLDVHADYNYHPITGLDRRVNVLLYLNRGWQAEWKGDLELWNQPMAECVRRIQPIFNRMVIFNVTDTAFHGHPDPLDCPENESRKSVALYYYSNGRPSDEQSQPHSTIFKRRPQDPVEAETEELRLKRAIRRISE